MSDLLSPPPFYKIFFRTLDDVESLSHTLAQYFPNPDAVQYGLHEILVNAVEHGNLAIGFEEKTALLDNNAWHEEVMRRLSLPEYSEKRGLVECRILPNCVQARIVDEGAGFDWKLYMRSDVEASKKLHGRGIATSLSVSFDSLEYVGCGNEVICTVFTPAI